MKRHILLFSALIATLTAFGASELDGYQFVKITGVEDKHATVVEEMNKIFTQKGFVMVEDGADSIITAPYAVIYVNIDKYTISPKSRPATAALTISMKNVFDKSLGTYTGKGANASLKFAKVQCAQQAMAEIAKMEYAYDAGKTPRPEIEKTDMDEAKAIAYLNTSKLDSIEGVYSEMRHDGVEFHMVIIRNGKQHKCIVTRPGNSGYAIGEVKATMCTNDFGDGYDVTWYNETRDIEKKEMFVERKGMIRFDEQRFLKIYPQN